MAGPVARSSLRRRIVVDFAHLKNKMVMLAVEALAPYVVAAVLPTGHPVSTLIAWRSLRGAPRCSGNGSIRGDVDLTAARGGWRPRTPILQAFTA